MLNWRHNHPICQSSSFNTESTVQFPESLANPSFTMLGASFLPARFRSDHAHVATSNPGYIHRQVTSVLQSVARRAFTHPIHTIVFVALLASTSYVGVLEGSLFNANPFTNDALPATDLASLVKGARHLKLGKDTAWKWQIDQERMKYVDKVRPLTSCRQRYTKRLARKQNTLLLSLSSSQTPYLIYIRRRHPWQRRSQYLIMFPH